MTDSSRSGISSKTHSEEKKCLSELVPYVVLRLVDQAHLTPLQSAVAHLGVQLIDVFLGNRHGDPSPGLDEPVPDWGDIDLAMEDEEDFLGE